MDESTKQKVYDTHRMWLKLEKAKDMKITEQTKIKDLIPEGYELKDVYKEGASIRETNSLSIHFKLKEKTFEDYADEYRKVYDEEDDLVGIIGNTSDSKYWDMRNKLGLLWYIVQQNGDVKKFYTLVFIEILKKIIYYNNGDFDDLNTGNNIFANNIFKLLPQSFIESFKEE
jgi:hypothetical protein